MTNLSGLLPLLNSPLRYIFRPVLHINDNKHRIVKLTANACHMLLPDGRYKATLYINNQYQERIDWALRLAHAFDINIANKYKPAWNLGFDSYSDQAATDDADLDANNPDTVTGAILYVQIGTFNGAHYRGVFKWDMTSIPSGPNISAAAISLWQFGNSADQNSDFSAYRIRRSWNEGTATWNTPWTTAGCGHENDDRDSIADYSARIELTAAEAHGEKQWELDEGSSDYSRVEAICGNSPSLTNNGYFIKADTEANQTYHNFRAAEYGTAGERPKLAITYTPGFIPKVTSII